jgi:elongator complex protein 6
MPPSSRIPSHLQPYVRLPSHDSLLLLTSTLGASANWLIIRFLCDALSNNIEDGGDEQGHNVVLVSWMREYDFWKQEARKSGGLDLEKLRRENRFAFVDGLSELCLDTSNGATSDGAERTPVQGAVAGSPTQRGPQTLPVRGPPGRMIPARGPPQAAAEPAASASAPATAPTSTQPPSTKQTTPGHHALKSLDLTHLRTTITTAVSALTSPTAPTAQRKTLLILDNPDLLLALNPTLHASQMTSLILALHMLPSVSHILTHVQSDNPLLSLSTPPQSLEIAHHNFLVKLGHMSRRILGVRVLDTGVARDVSGVVRVTEQRVGWMGLGFEDEKEKGNGDNGRGKEFLYQVKGDGSVRVFERGAGGEG